MKSKKLFAVVVFVVLAALGCAMSAAAEDAVFTCDSDPADFNGKTFENLYVLLNGCDNFKSTIFPDDNVFVTLRDITVTGTLHYVDDKYDAETGIYTAAIIGENETNADHYLNFAGESIINRLELECIDPHTCHLGLQFPSYIDELYTYPVNPLARGKIALHGYIDPLVDEATDYYADERVAAYPDIDLKTYENEFGHVAIASEEHIERLAAADLAYGLTIDNYADDPTGRKKVISYLKDACDTMFPVLATMLSGESESVYNLFFRGHINRMYVYNNYEQEPGETYITLSNISCDRLFVSNTHKEEGIFQNTDNLNWVPVIESAGYTNIGIASVYADFQTTSLDTAPYMAGADSLDYVVPPLYIDALVIGGEGKETNVKLESTQIYLMNYLGGLDNGSRLKLTTTDAKTKHAVNQAKIYILTINGGTFELLSESMFAASPTNVALYIMPGRDDFRFLPGEDGHVDAASIENIAAYEEYIHYDFSDGEMFDVIWEVTGSRFSQGFYNEAKTLVGYNWLGIVLNFFMGEIPDGVETNNNTKINTKNVSLGDMYVDAALGSDFMSGSCNFFQWGKPEGTITTIN